MGFFQKMASAFSSRGPASNTLRTDPYNQAWFLWLGRVGGQLPELAAQLQRLYPALSPADAQQLLAQLWEELGWATNEFYAVRDGKQTQEQAVQRIKEHLPQLDADNLNGLVARCQYSVDR